MTRSPSLLVMTSISSLSAVSCALNFREKRSSFSLIISAKLLLRSLEISLISAVCASFESAFASFCDSFSALFSISFFISASSWRTRSGPPFCLISLMSSRSMGERRARRRRSRLVLPSALRTCSETERSVAFARSMPKLAWMDKSSWSACL